MGFGRRVLLVWPPGWNLCVGGPHIALPTLKASLDLAGTECELVDLNLALADEFDLRISSTDVLEACKTDTLESMNRPYFAVADRMAAIGGQWGGTWSVERGFHPSGFSPRSSALLRDSIASESPLSTVARKLLVPRLQNSDIRLVGISVAVADQLLPAFQIAREARNAGFDGLIVLGGNVVSRLANELSQDWVFDLFDALVVFQGEQALQSLGDNPHLAGLKTAPNIRWRNDGVIVSNPIQRSIGTCLPAFDGLPVGNYWGMNYLPILSAKGCYYGHCSFCDIPFGWSGGEYLGGFDPKQVADAITALSVKYNMSRFKFVEEALAPSAARAIFTALASKGYSGCFEAYARLEDAWADTSLLKIASETGLRKLYLGLEVIPGTSRPALNKRDSASPLRLLALLHDHGIKVHIFSMFGFPGTGVDEAFATIDFLLKHASLVDTVDVGPYTFSKHTQVSGIDVVRRHHDDLALDFEYRPTQSGGVSSEEARELASQLEAVVYSQHPKWIHPIYRMYSPWCRT